MSTTRKQDLGVRFDPAGLRGETLRAGEKCIGTRFSVRLLGDVNVAWIRSLYLLQWQSLDYLDYHLSESCREMCFDCANPEWELPVKLGVLKELLSLIDRELATERAA